MIIWPSKTEGELKDYGLNWSPALSKLSGNPTIVASSWTRLSGSATKSAEVIQTDAKRTGIKIGGGTVGAVSVFRNTVTLSTGPILAADAQVRVRA